MRRAFTDQVCQIIYPHYLFAYLDHKLDCMHNHAPAFYRAHWLAKATWHVKARDVKTWKLEYPVGFLVRVCAWNLLSINTLLNIVARIESRCVIKAKHVLLVCKFVRCFAGKTALALKRSYIFPAKNRTSKQTNKTCFTTYVCFWLLLTLV